jgi:hypothetical protein
MKKFQDKSAADRLKDAAAARQAMLEKLKAQMPRPDDPAVQQRIAAQIALQKAREEREAAKRAEKERIVREEAERIAREEAEKIAAAQREAERIAAEKELHEAAQKAVRDARYAARKKRKKV